MFEFLFSSHWEYIVGNLATVATIFQFLSGVLVCKQYVNNKSTGEASALPFIFGLLSCGIWYLYGTVKDDDKIVFVNTVGFILMLLYITVFYKYALRSKDLRRQILGCVLFSIFMYLYLSHEDDIFREENILGSIACSLTLMTVAAPLVKLYYVIRVKSTECLPFQMILMAFFVSGLWMEYGILKGDTFLIVPNIIGALLAAFQLCLFMVYPSTPPDPGLSKTLVA